MEIFIISTLKTKRESYCCLIDDLVMHLAYFIREGNDKKRVLDSNSMLQSTVRLRTGLPRPLKILRKSVIDALTR